ncbi:hypothetical protein M5K25_024753 [Dendrobium thyrsiflorum]|uniref:Bulb-type lectin domain-containing protein n=1 Tax=Dendrobium thyrsiflorum TaxID=117978 RepID=A0ABD0U2Q5_DENTH
MHAKPLQGTINAIKMEQLNLSITDFIAMAALGHRDSFLNIIPLSFFLLIVLISASCSTAVTNVLLTGQTLSRQAGLSYANKVSFIMQYDCNLVIYNSGGNAIWHSNTAGIGSRNCILSFTNNGRLVVRNPSGRQLWISSNANSKVGKYVAVLLPDGKVSIFGPEVWSIAGVEESVSIGRNNSNEIVQPIETLENSPIIYNLLFSGQVLYHNGKLSDNGYSFIMKEDCELVLQKSNGKVSWRTWTKGNGKHCFARLNHKGELAIKDDAYKSVWNNWASEKAPVGEYVLVMQKNGDAVIYGPEVWTTKHDKSGLIELPTAEK